MRATARVCAVAPTTVLHWLGEAAEQRRALTRSVLGEVHVQQGPRDAWYAVRSAVKDGKRSADEALHRLSRSPHWVWTASDPPSQRLLAIAVGPRTRAMAQRVVPQVV
jgi:IS1 family transposase